MPVLVEADNANASEIARSLPPGSTVLRSIAEVEQWLTGRQNEYAVVVGPSLDIEAASAFADRSRLSRPGLSTILIREELDSEVYARAMQVGIGSVVAADDPAGLSNSVNRAKQNWELIHGTGGAHGAGETDGRVLTVFSPKGGVGKTTTSVNLAVALGQLGKSVCIVDLDLAFGDVAITLQLIPEHTIGQAAEAGDAVDFAMLNSLLTPYNDQVSVLAAPTHPEGRDRIPPPLVRRIIQALRGNFDFIVVDTAPGFDDHILQAFDETDACILVASLDVPTIKNMKMALETLDLLHLVPDARHLVLNRADDQVGLAGENVESVLAVPIAVSLPSSMEVPNATNHGQPIVMSRPDHPVARGIATLAAKIAGSHEAQPTQPEPVPEPARRGFFGKRK